MHGENEALNQAGLSAAKPSPSRHADTAAGRQDFMQREAQPAGPCAVLDRAAPPAGQCGVRQSKQDLTQMQSRCTQSTPMGLRLAWTFTAIIARPDLVSRAGAVVPAPSACSASIQLHLRKTLLPSPPAVRCHARRARASPEQEPHAPVHGRGPGGPALPGHHHLPTIPTTPRGRTPCTRIEPRSYAHSVSPTGNRDVGETAPQPRPSHLV